MENQAPYLEQQNVVAKKSVTQHYDAVTSQTTMTHFFLS